MKNYILFFALAAGMLASCDTQKEEGTFQLTKVDASGLLEGATFAQYDAVVNADGSITYTPSADGNYIEYNLPKVPSVDIYYIKPDGSEAILTYGRSGGMFPYVPLRGSDPVQTLYFRYVDADLNEYVATKEFTLKVAQELAPEVKLLTSNSGSKKWKWMPTTANGGAVWGNGGYQAGAQDGSENINGAWWGCGILDGECGDKFDSQLQHSAAGKITGEEYADAYMQFNEDGSVEKYDYQGNKLGSGTFAVEGWDGGAAIDDLGNMAYLKTSAGAILWPYAINMSGFMPDRFEVAYLSVDRMVLIYAPEGQGAWGECTWWSFASDDDAEGFVTTSDWGWAPTTANGGAVWGNAGYCAGDQDGSENINGAWWGCGVLDGECGDKFDSQLQHSAAGKITGEEYMDAKMSFAEDGTLVKYAADGSVLGEGKWSIDMTPNPDHFSKGTLTTSAGAILWPYAINMGGFTPEKFEIGYLSGSRMVLIYAPDGQGAWGECTWWSFGKK